MSTTFTINTLSVDQCVLCGMCSTVCPTYQLKPIETESPRGRLSIIQYYAKQNHTPSKSALAHIGHCTGCNLCQDICPSSVPFEALIDQFKADTSNKNSFFLHHFLQFAKKPRGFNRFKLILGLYKKCRLSLFLSRLPLPVFFKHAQQLLSHTQHSAQRQYKSLDANKISVGLFIGCTDQLFDQQTLNDALYVLHYLGIQTAVSNKQYCCGALHQHNGEPDTAYHLSRQNDNLFSQDNIKQVLFCSSGCGKQLRKTQTNIEYSNIINFVSPYLIHSASFKSLNESIYIHHSCSSRSQETNTATTTLLKQIPEIQLTDISNNSCCGAGGSNLLTYPELAKDLIADKIQQVAESPSRLLISDNIGCSLHFKNQLAAFGIDIEVIHPISLIARQLR